MIYLKKFIVFMLIIGPFATLHASSIYKWTDSDGNVHFGEKPPVTQQAKRIELPKSVTNPPNSSVDTAGEESPDKQEGSSSTPLAEYNKRNCDIATENLQLYSQHSQFQQPDGSITKMSTQERIEKMKEMQEAVDQFCK